MSSCRLPCREPLLPRGSCAQGPAGSVHSAALKDSLRAPAALVLPSTCSPLLRMLRLPPHSWRHLLAPLLSWHHYPSRLRNCVSEWFVCGCTRVYARELVSEPRGTRFNLKSHRNLFSVCARESKGAKYVGPDVYSHASSGNLGLKISLMLPHLRRLTPSSLPGREKKNCILKRIMSDFQARGLPHTAQGKSRQ